jgi:hypothetical protein
MKQLLEHMLNNLDEETLNELLHMCDCICTKVNLVEDITTIDVFSSAYLQSIAKHLGEGWYEEDNFLQADHDFNGALLAMSDLTGTSPELLLIKLVNEWGRSEIHKLPKTTKVVGQ